jgi:hypothetical protein
MSRAFENHELTRANGEFVLRPYALLSDSISSDRPECQEKQSSDDQNRVMNEVLVSTHQGKKPKIITEEQIIASARLFVERYGRLPTKNGNEQKVPNLHHKETWISIDYSIRNGRRGLAKNDDGLGGLLNATKIELVAGGKLKGELTVESILRSAKLFAQKYHKLPTPHDKDKEVPGMPLENWAYINNNIFTGQRGLVQNSGGLKAVLETLKEDLARSGVIKSDLTPNQVLSSARLFYQRFGKLPTKNDGDKEVPGLALENWVAINSSIVNGNRGFLENSGGLKAIVEPLKEELIREGKLKGNLCEQAIIQAARDVFDQDGRLPSTVDVEVPGMSDETWRCIDSAIKKGHRGLDQLEQGLPGILRSLKVELIEAGRLKPDALYKGDLTPENVIEKAKVFYGQCGRLPSNQDMSKAVPGLNGETWDSVHSCIKRGARGLFKINGGLPSLLRPLKVELIEAGKLKPDVLYKGELTVEGIIKSAKLFFEQHGRLPHSKDKDVPGKFGETWHAINYALMRGGRGLPRIEGALSQLLSPLRQQLSLHLTSTKRPRLFNREKSKQVRLVPRTKSLKTNLETRSKPLTVFAKGEAFEQVVGLLLASLDPEKMIVPQYCLRVEPENKYFGMRADYKVGDEIYEVKWGKASSNITETYHKHMAHLPEGMNYHLLMLEANGEISLPYKRFDFMAASSPLKEGFKELETYLRELVENDAGFELEEVRNYLYGLVMKANKLFGKLRLEFIATELTNLFAETGESRRAYMKTHNYALYSPLEAYCEYKGKLWRDLIEVRALDKERPGQYQLRHSLNDLCFKNQIDRDTAVVLEMTEEAWRAEDLLNYSETGNYEQAMFSLPSGKTLASRVSGLEPDHVIDSINDLRPLFKFAPGDFEFAKEFIESYS